MSWLSEIFPKATKKELLSEKSKAQLNKLVMIAALENRLEPSDINLITEQVTFIKFKERGNKNQQIRSYRKSLPRFNKEKFNLIFYLVMSLMRYGALSEKKEEILIKTAQVLHDHQERCRELISFIANNIRNGLNADDSYLRLGYLMEKPRYTS